MWKYVVVHDEDDSDESYTPVKTATMTFFDTESGMRDYAIDLSAAQIKVHRIFKLDEFGSIRHLELALNGFSISVQEV